MLLICSVDKSWTRARPSSSSSQPLKIKIFVYFQFITNIFIFKVEINLKIFYYVPVWAVLTTSVWGKSKTFIPFMVRIISPTSRPLVSAGVFGSMAETTTGRDPWIRNPNSPRTRKTCTVLLHSEKKWRNSITYYSFLNQLFKTIICQEHASPPNNLSKYLPNVRSSIRLYITALDFLCTIRWVIAWYLFRNSRSLIVDSIDSDRWSGTILLSSENR